jgi:hypothetical protein
MATLRRILLPRPQRTGAGARAPRHVHPHRLARPHHPGSHRQRRRRSPRRPREKSSRHCSISTARSPSPTMAAASRSACIRKKRFRWSCWLSRACMPAASSTKLRQFGLCLFRWPAWRRRRGHQRLVHPRRGRSAARRQDLASNFPAAGKRSGAERPAAAAAKAAPGCGSGPIRKYFDAPRATRPNSNACCAPKPCCCPASRSAFDIEQADGSVAAARPGATPTGLAGYLAELAGSGRSRCPAVCRRKIRRCRPCRLRPGEGAAWASAGMSMPSPPSPTST